MYKILVVDDAGFMRMMIKNYLTKAGYETIIEGEDGEKAVSLYKSEAAGSGYHGYHDAQFGRHRCSACH